MIGRCEGLKYRLFLLAYFIILTFAFQWNGEEQMEKQRKEKDERRKTKEAGSKNPAQEDGGTGGNCACHADEKNEGFISGCFTGCMKQYRRSGTEECIDVFVNNC